MNRQLDVLFVNPNVSPTYQGLGAKYSAIEPPVWSLLLAQSCRSAGYGVAILDCDALRLTDEECAEHIHAIGPRLVCWAVYGQNPNSSSVSMGPATKASRLLRQTYPEHRICFVGNHVSALPRETMSRHPEIDFVLQNEGVYAIRNLLSTDLEDVSHVKGIGYRCTDQIVMDKWRPIGEIVLTDPEMPVPTDRMDHDLPGYAWDLLPYDRRPLDLYRAHYWHSYFDDDRRSPFAAIYSSLGCQMKCNFCMINIINRINNSDGIHAANSNVMRFWSPEFILREVERLASMGVTEIRISDEMFFLNPKYYHPLVRGLIERDLGLNMWAYARVDTVKERFLDEFKRAGINWLALGIEAANQKIRHEVTKGTFEEVDIKDVVRQIRAHDVNVIANYIFGFPSDTVETMRETLGLACELNTEMANMYPCQALPGSPLYFEALQKGWELPDEYEGWSFLSYESLPLPTDHLGADEVLRFRDEAWTAYFTRREYLDLVESKFGRKQRENVEELSRVKLRRRILGD